MAAPSWSAEHESLLMMRSLTFVNVSAFILAVSLAGCREAEQSRPLQFEQGTYRGMPDEKLSDAQVRELQQRGSLMR